MASGFRRHDTMGTVSRFALCACVVATLVVSATSASFEAKQDQRRQVTDSICTGPDCFAKVETITKRQRIAPRATHHD